MAVTRSDVLGFRVRAQQLDRVTGTVDDAALLDAGAQDTGPDGGPWALAIRGLEPPADRNALAMVWTLRGAPHLYRRTDLPGVAAAVEPFSDADAGHRIHDAAKPLGAAGIGIVGALDAIAAAMREVVTEPMVKGELSSRLAEVMPQPYLRHCRPCAATHLYEMPFRLAALRAGLELEPGTSPPVLRRIPRFRRAASVPPHLDPVRCYLRLLGPATPKDVAAHLESRVREVQARWPADAVEVDVEGTRRWVLADDEPALRDGGPPPAVVRLLGPYDLFLQTRDRPFLVEDPARAKALWPVLGRPGAVLAGGEIGGLWRPRQSGGKLRLQVEPWDLPVRARAAVEREAERLAAHRGVTLTGVDWT